MKGTAILYPIEKDIVILEDVEANMFKEIKEQCNCDHCNCHVEKNRVVDYGRVSTVGWKDSDIDWDYGY